jgi:hypothetical protein
VDVSLKAIGSIRLENFYLSLQLATTTFVQPVPNVKGSSQVNVSDGASVIGI